jgi:stress response protein SCP2
MAVKLSKGQAVSLRKSESDLSQVTIGLGWDVVEKKRGLLGALFGPKEEDYDLDVVAFLCGANGKVADLGLDAAGNMTLLNSDVVFYNNQRHPSGKIWLTGDNRTGAGDGDDEQIVVLLNDIPQSCQKIVFVVQIYQGQEKGQSFGNVRSAFIRAVDRHNSEMVRFDLSAGPAFASYRSMVFAELVREGSDWKFNAIGAPFETDSFVNLLGQYL